MKRFTTLLAASALSVTLFAGVANAGSEFVPGPNLKSGDIAQMYQGGNFSIVYLQENDNESNNSYYLDYVTYPEIHKTEIAGLQKSLAANKELKSALLSRNVQINNVVAADKAADGSVTFYIR